MADANKAPLVSPVDGVSTEARVTINGVELSYGQSMTLRVALESFASDLSLNGLGEDESGRATTEGYLARIQEIRTALYVCGLR